MLIIDNKITRVFVKKIQIDFSFTPLGFNGFYAKQTYKLQPHKP